MAAVCRIWRGSSRIFSLWIILSFEKIHRRCWQVFKHLPARDPGFFFLLLGWIRIEHFYRVSQIDLKKEKKKKKHFYTLDEKHSSHFKLSSCSEDLSIE